MSILQTTD